MTKIEQLKQNIAGFEKLIANPATPPAVKKAVQKALEGAQAELKEEEKAEGKTPPAAAKEKAPDKDATPAATGKRKRRTKQEMAADKAAGKTPAASAKKEKKEEAEDPEYITVKGTKYNINDCEEVMAAVHARKERDAESGKKTRSKSDGKKAEEQLVRAVDTITELVPEQKIEDQPETVIAGLKQFEEGMKHALGGLKKAGVSEANISRLKKALDSVDDVIKDIKEELKKAKK